MKEFPELPYCNPNGFVFSKREMDELLSICSKCLSAHKKRPEEFSLEIAEVLLSVLANFDPSTGLDVGVYTYVCMRNKITKWSRSQQQKIRILSQGSDMTYEEIKVRELPLSAAEYSMSEDLTDHKSVLYSIVRDVERVVGIRAGKYLRLKYVGLSDQEISRIMGVSTRTMQRDKARIEKLLIGEGL